MTEGGGTERVSEWDPDGEFAAHRGRLFGLAYRLLGSAADAEDMVQEAFLRWSGAEHASIEAPGAWLAKTVTNLCLNHLNSARARRERYVGPWLPEPVCTEDETLGPLEQAQQRESVSMALLALLERLSPAERAVFVLREAFGYDHRSIAETVQCSPAHSRQLYRRATLRLQEDRPRFGTNREERQQLVERFLAAAHEGNLPELERLLTTDVVSWSDGGGRARAARHPVAGSARVSRLVAGLLGGAGEAVTVSVRELNGVPAILAHENGGLLAATLPHSTGGKIAALYTVTNPDKLRFLRRQLGRLSQTGELSGPPD